MSRKIAFICGRQGLSIFPALQDIVGTGNVKGFLSEIAWREQSEDQRVSGHTSVILSPSLLKREIQAFRPDIIFVMTYLEKLDVALAEHSQFGMLNIHPSLLPKYRGGAPVFFALLEGVEETGVTFHHITEQFDQGPIVGQFRVRIQPTDCASTVWMKLTRKIIAALPKLIAQCDSWKSLAIEQDNTQATYVSFPTLEERSLSRVKTIEQNLRVIKACGRTNGARLPIADVELFVTRAGSASENADLLACDEDFYATDSELFFRASDGWVMVKEAFMDGKSFSDWQLFDVSRDVCS